MERIINLQVEKQPEGVWLATSTDVQGLVVEAENLTDLVNWSQEIARDLIALQERMQGATQQPPLADRLSLPIVIAA